MKLKCPLVGAAFAVATVVGGSANAASSAVNLVDSAFSYSSATPADALDDFTSMTRAGTGPKSGATIGTDADRYPDRIDDNLFGSAGTLVVEDSGMLFPARFTRTSWSSDLRPIASGYHLARYNLDSDRSNPRHLGTISGFVVSEPATWAMMLLGVVLMAAGLRTMSVKRDGPANDEKLYSL